MKVNLGCGGQVKEGFVGIDLLQFPGVDIVHDLNIFPYPFKDNEIDEIWMDQVLEHLSEPLKVVEELYRIAKKGAKITIGVPYFRSMYATIDPTHRNFFGLNWFNYFDPKHTFNQRYQYSKAKFEIVRIEIDRETKKKGFFYGKLIAFAGKRPMAYELKAFTSISI